MRYRHFEVKDLVQLHDCFQLAFSDYAVPFRMSYDTFKNRMLYKSKIDSAISCILCDNEMIAGFLLHTTANYENKLTAYNAGTGLLQSYRGKGHMKKAYAWLLPKIHTTGASRVLLEVITSNVRAFELYHSLGFQITKEYLCFKQKHSFAFLSSDYRVIEASVKDLSGYHDLLLYKPGFLDSDPFLMNHLSREVVLEAYDGDQLCGYVIFQKENGRISQMGTENTLCGQVLLHAVQSHLAENLRITIMNIEKRHSEWIDFLTEVGFENQVSQYEMELKLDNYASN